LRFTDEGWGDDATVPALKRRSRLGGQGERSGGRPMSCAITDSGHGACDPLHCLPPDPSVPGAAGDVVKVLTSSILMRRGATPPRWTGTQCHYGSLSVLCASSRARLLKGSQRHPVPLCEKA
jgi:hypothetical protein